MPSGKTATCPAGPTGPQSLPFRKPCPTFLKLLLLALHRPLLSYLRALAPAPSPGSTSHLMLVSDQRPPHPQGPGLGLPPTEPGLSFIHAVVTVCDDHEFPGAGERGPAEVETEGWSQLAVDEGCRNPDSVKDRGLYDTDARVSLAGPTIQLDWMEPDVTRPIHTEEHAVCQAPPLC